MSGIGPGLPPHLLAKRKREAEEAQASIAATKPSTSPPSSPNSDKRRRIAEPSLPSSNTAQKDVSPPRKVLGPAMPPAPLDQMPRAPAAAAPADDSDSSDDDYGPSLPSAADAHAESTFDIPTLSREEQAIEDAKPKREGWMTLPPSADGLKNMDPLKQRARGFNTSRHTNPAKGSGIAATWTETPDEKRVRLQKEMMGIVEPEGPVRAGKVAAQPDSKDEETKRRIKEYTEKYRGESLMAKHQKGDKKVEDDDPTKRGFNWEKDMNTVGKVSASNKKEMVSRASDFSRFSGGGYL
jgi:hypothetical protein